MLETIGVAKNGRYVLPPMNAELHMRWLSDCEGSFVKAKWTKVGKPKTQKQLGVHFGLAVEIVRQVMIDKGYGICGIPPNKQMVHEILSKSCGGVGPLGESVRLSEMTSDQASKYFENIRDWAAKELNVYILDPDPNWKTKSKES